MLQIIALYLSRLSVKLYFTYMQFVLKAIANFPIIEEKFKIFVDDFRSTFNRLNHIYMKVDLVFYTEAVQKADNARDEAFIRLRNALRAVLIGPDDAKKPAAEVLLKIVSLYGGIKIPDQKMNEESASVTNLIEDFEQKYSAQVELLGISDLVADLTQKNEAFLQAYYDRVAYDSTIGKNAMVKIRREMDAAYRAFVTAVNLAAKHDVEGRLSAFIRLLNTEIERLRSSIGQGKPNGSDTQLPDLGEEDFEEEEEFEEEETEGSTPPTEKPDEKPSDNPESKPEDKPSEDNKPNEGGSTGSGTGNENTGGTPPEDEDPNMPPPGSGGSGFE